MCGHQRARSASLRVPVTCARAGPRRGARSLRVAVIGALGSAALLGGCSGWLGALEGLKDLDPDHQTATWMERWVEDGRR